MAAFRKALLALAAVAAVSSTAPPALAQLNCTAGVVPPVIRVEGLTEYIGDIFITCTGGTPTANGTLIPVDNFEVDITDTNITSRLLNQNRPGYPYVESTLVINDAFPKDGTANPAYQNPSSIATPTLSSSPFSITQNACPTPDQSGKCTFLGNGKGGWGTEGSDATSSYGTANNQGGQTPYNVFQGYQLSSNAVRFDGIPVDPPAPCSPVAVCAVSPQISFRITNIRVDATPFASSTPASGFGPPINASVTITGYQPVILNGGTAMPAAYPFHTLKQVAVSVAQSLICQGCGTASDASGGTGIPYQSTTFSYYVQENFADAFKAQTWYYNDTSPYIKQDPQSEIGYGPLHTHPNQDVNGYAYSTESNFYPNGDPDLSYFIDAPEAGEATNGTRLVFVINSLIPGVTITAPAVAGLYPIELSCPQGPCVFSPTGETSIDSPPQGYSRGSVFPNPAPASDPVVGGLPASGIAILLGAVAPNGSVTADYAGPGTFYTFTPVDVSVVAAAANEPIQFVYEIMYADGSFIETLWVPFNISNCNLAALPTGSPVIATAQVGIGPVSNGQYTSNGLPNNAPSNAVYGKGDYSFPRFVWGVAGNPLPPQNVWYLDNLTCSQRSPNPVHPRHLVFGGQLVNDSAALKNDPAAIIKTVKVTNNTDSPTPVSYNVTGADAGDFSPPCGATLAPHSSCTISIQFDPHAAGTRSAKLTFSGTPESIQPTVTLTGAGLLPLAVSPTSVDFGSHGLKGPIAARVVTVTNNTGSSTPLSFAITGAARADFSPHATATTCGATLAAHSSCVVSIRFDPKAKGTQSAMLTFSGTPGTTQPAVTLTGTGN